MPLEPMQVRPPCHPVHIKASSVVRLDRRNYWGILQQRLFVFASAGEVPIPLKRESSLFHRLILIPADYTGR